jgi:serine palmitoyltransferase
VDETLSFGVLGNSGRGLTDHFGVDVSSVDVLLGSNATSLGGVGGFCAGNHEVLVVCDTTCVCVVLAAMMCTALMCGCEKRSCCVLLCRGFCLG